MNLESLSLPSVILLPRRRSGTPNYIQGILRHADAFRFNSREDSKQKSRDRPSGRIPTC